MKVCDKTCMFCFFPVINKYLCMAKRSLLSERPSYIQGSYSFSALKNKEKYQHQVKEAGHSDPNIKC